MSRVYYVGGCVRDELLGKSIFHDIDYVFVAQETEFAKSSPLAFANAWKALFQYLESHSYQVLTCSPECWTVRCKASALEKGGPSVVDFVLARHEIGLKDEDCRIPKVELGTLEQDLGRRDFTINAMAQSCETRELIDPFNGLKDLREKRLATVVDALKSLWFDPIRILRALRFHVTLGFQFDDHLWQGICTPSLLERLCNNVPLEQRQKELVLMFRHDTVATLRLCSRLEQDCPIALELLFKGIWLLPTTRKRIKD